jgi:hypothetical protein
MSLKYLLILMHSLDEKYYFQESCFSIVFASKSHENSTDWYLKNNTNFLC